MAMSMSLPPHARSSSRKQQQHQQLNVTTNERVALATSSKKGLLLCATIVPSLLVPIPALAVQAKQAELLVEKLVTSLTTQKVLDKITTVITGQTTIEPESLIKVISEEPDDAWEAFKSNFFDVWSTSIDYAANFDPAAFAQTSWELLGDFAERFATWELSSLVALGERWLIWTPMVILPMAWQMNEKQKQQNFENDRKRQSVGKLSEADKEKREQVYLELRKMELRSALLVAVEEVSNKKPVEELARELTSFNLTSEQANTVDGKWRLIYGTQTPGASLLPQLPGFEITDHGQRLILHQNKDEAHVQNSATIRLGPLGAVQVTVEGMQDRATSSMSLNTFQARVVEMLGAPIRVQLPGLNIEVPESLRQTTEWKLLYADDQIRINEDGNANLYLFLRSD